MRFDSLEAKALIPLAKPWTLLQITPGDIAGGAVALRQGLPQKFSEDEIAQSLALKFRANYQIANLHNSVSKVTCVQRSRFATSHPSENADDIRNSRGLRVRVLRQVAQPENGETKAMEIFASEGTLVDLEGGQAMQGYQVTSPFTVLYSKTNLPPCITRNQIPFRSSAPLSSLPSG